MADKRKRRGQMGLCAVPLILAIAYAACYVGLSQSVSRGTSWTGRVYRSVEVAKAFIPAAWIESKVSGKQVVVAVPAESSLDPSAVIYRVGPSP